MLPAAAPPEAFIEGGVREESLCDSSRTPPSKGYKPPKAVKRKIPISYCYNNIKLTEFIQLPLNIPPNNKNGSMPLLIVRLVLSRHLLTYLII